MHEKNKNKAAHSLGVKAIRNNALKNNQKESSSWSGAVSAYDDSTHQTPNSCKFNDA